MNTMNTLKFATDPVRLARAKSSFVLVGIVAPLLIGFAATLVVLLWLPELPDPVATHWSATGGPDGFSPAWSLPVMIAALTVGLTALLAGTILASTRGGRWGGHRSSYGRRDAGNRRIPRDGARVHGICAARSRERCGSRFD